MSERAYAFGDADLAAELETLAASAADSEIEWGFRQIVLESIAIPSSRASPGTA